ncbi:MAG TPA: UbiA family prenyltransferase [Candidatus Paceibacterota bacterium]
MDTLFTKSIRYLEESAAPVWYCIATFFAATTLRNFFEAFSSGYTITPDIILNYTASYAALGLVLLVLFNTLTGVELIKLLRLISSGFLILASVPLVDLILSSGKGFYVAFLMPEVHGSLLVRFFTFFGPMGQYGVSPGMKLEIALVLAVSFFYIYEKCDSLLRAALGTLAVYTTIFFYLALPYALEFFAHLTSISFWPADPTQRSLVGTSVFILICFAVLGYIAYTQQKSLLHALLRDLRAPRLIHYWLMFLLGYVLASSITPPSGTLFLSLLLVPLAIMCAWVFSVITNNIADIEIDRVSNPSRPLVVKSVALAEYRAAGFISLAAALFAAAAAGFSAFFAIVLFIGNYFLYSMPPLRLKRVPYFSKLAVVVNSAVLAMLGYAMATGISTSDSGYAAILALKTSLASIFPITFALFFVLILAVNFIDIKDYDGDKQEGIKTLPVLLGLPLSKLIIGASFFILYCAIAFMLSNAWLSAGTIGFGLLQFLLINKKMYREQPVFAVHLLSLVCLLFIVS